jgi:hypothetical protein
MTDKRLTTALVKHMLTQDFSDNGTWGGNRTEAIYLIASLPKEQKDRFYISFLTKFGQKLREVLDDREMGLASPEEIEKAKEAFSQHNPKFTGRFLLPS